MSLIFRFVISVRFVSKRDTFLGDTLMRVDEQKPVTWYKVFLNGQTRFDVLLVSNSSFHILVEICTLHLLPPLFGYQTK